MIPIWLSECVMSLISIYSTLNLFEDINCKKGKIVIAIIYLQASSAAASVRGLKGCKTLNKDPDPKNPIEGREER